MFKQKTLAFLLGLLLVLSAGQAAEDTVTIPKSRLAELEKQEAELKKLKGQPAQSFTNSPPARPNANAAVLAPAARPAVPDSAVADLPPLEAGAIVDAEALAMHYQANPASADRRYLKKRFTVRGEIVRFDKPFLSRKYGMVLKAGGPACMVECELVCPEAYEAVFVAKNGSQIVGQSGRTQTVLAQVGDQVLVEGQCKGLKKGVIAIKGSGLKHLP